MPMMVVDHEGNVILPPQDMVTLVETSDEETVDWCLPKEHARSIQRLKEAALEFYRKPIGDGAATAALFEAACDWGYVIYGDNDPE